MSTDWHELYDDPADLVRGVFAKETFVRPADAGFRVGVHRRSVEDAHLPLPERLFAFAR